MNKINFFNIYIVPAILSLLLKKIMKNIYKINLNYTIFGQRNTEILLVLRQSSNTHNLFLLSLHHFPRVFHDFPDVSFSDW